MQQKEISFILILMLVSFIPSLTGAAIDNVDKRSSVINIALPAGRVLPSPNGDINAGDRQHVSYCYDALYGENFTKDLGDTVTLSDIITKYSTITLTDALSLGDSISKGISVPQTDSIAYSDDLSRVSAFYKSLSDTLSLSDSLSMQVIVLLSDALSLADDITPVLNGGGVNLTKLFEDTITLTDSQQKAMAIYPSDSITFSDLLSLQYALLLSDSLSLSDVLSRVVIFYRTLSDTLGLTDAINAGLVLAEILKGSEVPQRLFQTAVPARQFDINVPKRIFESMVPK